MIQIRANEARKQAQEKVLELDEDGNVIQKYEPAPRPPASNPKVDLKPLQKKHIREERFRACLYTTCFFCLFSILATLVTIFVLFAIRPTFEISLLINHDLAMEPQPPNFTYGDIELHFNEKIGLIDAASSFGFKEAQVVCKQLGFDTLQTLGYSKNLFGTDKYPAFVMKELQCNGQEEKLEDCSYNLEYESKANAVASVFCMNHSSIILVNQSLPYITNSFGYLGPICSHSWGFNEASVFCKELGYSTVASYNFTNPTFHVQQSFALQYLSCQGNEVSLNHCELNHDLDGLCPAKSVATVLCKA